MYKIIVLTRKYEKGASIEKTLRSAGVEHCKVATTMIDAAIWAKEMSSNCVFVERELTKEVQTVFRWFHDPYLKFVALRDRIDYMDSIDCLNTRRFVADIIYPFSEKDVRQALSNLEFYL